MDGERAGDTDDQGAAVVDEFFERVGKGHRAPVVGVALRHNVAIRWRPEAVEFVEQR